MNTNDRCAAWFFRAVWIGILVNLAFAVPAMFWPDRLMDVFGLGPPVSPVWLRNVGMLLVSLCLFYVPSADDPFRYATFARLTAASRLIASVFWLWLILSGINGLWTFFLVDFGLFLSQGLLLRCTLRGSGTEGARMRRSWLSRLIAWKFSFLNRLIPWHRWPRWIGVFNLWSLRNDLREVNLHDTSHLESTQAQLPAQPHSPSAAYLRTDDGSYNDLDDPRMGSAGARFGRNVPLDEAWPDVGADLLDPSPREISRRLMTRDAFKPAETLNLLAAAWIQFQNHDWFSHLLAKPEPALKPLEIPLRADDDWHENPMRIPPTPADDSRPPGSAGPPTYRNTESHWWDGSQIYGSTALIQKGDASNPLEYPGLRTFKDGKLKVDERGRLLEQPQSPGIDLTGFNDNYWVGLSLLHTLFTREHNAICDRLRAEFSDWSDERLFGTARLINAALMAKIHTVEWTPGILGHPALQIAMPANWWGLLGENFYKKRGRVSQSEALSGIPGSPKEHHTAPFALTEEFVSVYRLHPLIPDNIRFCSARNGELIADVPFEQVQGRATRPLMDRVPLTDLFYSLGIANPGKITLHNFPKALQNFERTDGSRFDLAAVDILRDRERGVPRYNRFRELLRMPPVREFRELTSNRQWADEIERVYNGKIDRVDLIVGMFAEDVPKGFGFSDTAFRIFILMASRRLKSDRFFTTDYRPEVYTQAGLNWINENDMSTVLLRHFPELKTALDGVGNAFAPWNRM